MSDLQLPPYNVGLPSAEEKQDVSNEFSPDPVVLIILIVFCVVLLLVFFLITFCVVCRCKRYFRPDEPELKKFKYYLPQDVLRHANKMKADDTEGKKCNNWNPEAVEQRIVAKQGINVCSQALHASACKAGSTLRDNGDDNHHLSVHTNVSTSRPVSSVNSREDGEDLDEENNNAETLSARCHHHNVSNDICAEEHVQYTSAGTNDTLPPGLARYIHEHFDEETALCILKNTNDTIFKSEDTLIIMGDPSVPVFPSLPRSLRIEREMSVEEDHSQYGSDGESLQSSDHNVTSVASVHGQINHALSYESILSSDTAAFEAEQATKYLGANNDISVLSQSEMSIHVRSCPNSPIVSRTPGFVRKYILPAHKRNPHHNPKSEPKMAVRTDDHHHGVDNSDINTQAIDHTTNCSLSNCNCREEVEYSLCSNSDCSCHVYQNELDKTVFEDNVAYDDSAEISTCF